MYSCYATAWKPPVSVLSNHQASWKMESPVNDDDDDNLLLY